MRRKTKFYLLIGPVLVSFISATTSPIVQIYFMKLVSTEILAISNVIGIGLAAIVNSTIASDKAKELYRKHFTSIVITDVCCFIAISYGSLLDVSIRFLGIAVINSVSTTLWFIIMQNAINRTLDGDRLTNWNAFEKSIELYASLLGCLIAICNFNISVEFCIAMQCFGNLIMGITDLKAFSILSKNK